MNSVDWGRCTGEWQGEDGEEGVLEPAQLPMLFGINMDPLLGFCYTPKIGLSFSDRTLV